LTNKDENDSIKSQYEYEYDGNKNITSKTETIDAVEEETGYTYDEQNRLLTVTEGTDVTTYEYDLAGNRTIEIKGLDETTNT
jgi:YD repeat-containing protein